MSVEDAPPSFPFTASDRLEPPAQYAELLAHAPVSQVTLPSGDPAWLVTRYDDVRMVLSDARFSREAITAPGAPRVLPIAQGSKSLFVMDPPEHGRLRQLVSKAFSSRRMEALRPRVQEITDGLVAAMLRDGQPADLMKGLAEPLPITVICELLGVPYSDVDQFRTWTDIMLSFDANRRDDVINARNALSAYLTDLIDKKRAEPTDDLLMVLITEQIDGDRLTEDELLAFGYTLLGAGYHATTATLAHATLRLLREPEQLRKLRDNPELVPAATEELLRLSQAGGGVGALRIATEDVKISGVRIQAGEAVLPSINAANQDPAAFSAPDTMDLRRSSNHHVTFGYGIHHCLGAQLGRIELAIAVGTLLREMPDLSGAVAEDELVWSSGAAFSRPEVLPITW